MNISYDSHETYLSRKWLLAHTYAQPQVYLLLKHWRGARTRHFLAGAEGAGNFENEIFCILYFVQKNEKVVNICNYSYMKNLLEYMYTWLWKNMKILWILLCNLLNILTYLHDFGIVFCFFFCYRSRKTLKCRNLYHRKVNYFLKG